MINKFLSHKVVGLLMIAIVVGQGLLPGSSLANAATFQPVSCYPRETVSVLWNDQGNRLAIVGQSKIILLDDAYQIIQIIETGEIRSAISWHPDGNFIAVAQSRANTIQIWDTTTVEVVHTFRLDEQGVIGDISWHPDGNLLASAHPSSLLTKVVVWNVSTEEVEYIFAEPLMEVLDLEWDATGEFLAAASLRDYGGVFIIDFTANIAITRIGNMGEANFLAWNNEGTMLISESFTNTRNALHIWETESFVMIHIFDFDTEVGFNSVQWRPDDSQVAVVDYRQSEILVLDIPSGEVVATLESGTNFDLIPLEHMSIAWHPSGRELVEAGCDNTLRVWDMETYELIQEIAMQDLIGE